MLDLAFVRNNLELVEEKLRARGLDPAALLGNFRELDQERRSRITRAESLQAERNRLSQEGARSRKAGADSAQVAAVISAVNAVLASDPEAAAYQPEPIL